MALYCQDHDATASVPLQPQSVKKRQTDFTNPYPPADHLFVKINYTVMSSPFRIDCIPLPKLPSSAAWRTAGVYTSGALVSSAPKRPLKRVCALT